MITFGHRAQPQNDPPTPEPIGAPPRGRREPSPWRGAAAHLALAVFVGLLLPSAQAFAPIVQGSPVPVDPGEGVQFVNGATVVNMTGSRMVIDDRGEVNGTRRALLLGPPHRPEPANGATCRPIPVMVNVQHECFLAAESWVEIFEAE